MSTTARPAPPGGAPGAQTTFRWSSTGGVPPGAGGPRFKYDPLKRVPPPPVLPDFSKLKDEDFALYPQQSAPGPFWHGGAFL